jgi:hypothetical protein
VQNCIAKDPDARWQSAADLAGELRWIAEREAPASPAPVGHGSAGLDRGDHDRNLNRGCLAVALLTRKTPDAAVARFSFAPPFKTDVVDVAVSPDGRRITFAGDGSGSGCARSTPLLLRRCQAQRGPTAILVPDGRSIGFSAPTG